MSNVRVMIVDSDSRQAEALSEKLRQHENMELISVASSRESAIKQLPTKPDVLLLNPDVLKVSSLSRFLHSIQEKTPGTRTLILTKEIPSDDNAISDLKTGIRGFLKITESAATVSKAILAVHGGALWAERRLLEMMLSKPMLLPETLQAHIPGLTPLTNREMEMLTMVLQGASNKEIADKSSISERTVKTHLYRVYRKLKVKSRTKAIALLSH